MIVSGGENVFPGEVADLLRGHDAIADAAVIGVDDDQMGQRLAAYVVRASGADLGADAVRDLVKSRLARYKVPSFIEFVEGLPKSAIGKVLRRELHDAETSGRTAR